MGNLFAVHLNRSSETTFWTLWSQQQIYTWQMQHVSPLPLMLPLLIPSMQCGMHRDPSMDHCGVLSIAFCSIWWYFEDCMNKGANLEKENSQWKSYIHNVKEKIMLNDCCPANVVIKLQKWQIHSLILSPIKFWPSFLNGKKWLASFKKNCHIW